MPRPEAILFPRWERVEERRKEEDRRKLQDEFFDHATLLAIGQLVNRGLFEAIDFPISTGKEGGVFRTSGAAGFRALKVYRIGNTVFRNLPPHVVEEFRRGSGLRGASRVIAAWTRREHSILRRMREGGVRVPEPLGYLRNVLVMEFIGNAAGEPAPRLKDALIEDPDRLRAQFIEQVRAMLGGAHLVHGDLSPYNVLQAPDGGPVLIDVVQSVESTHPQARELLERDLRNFSRFFERIGASGDEAELWSAVGGDQVGPRERPGTGGRRRPDDVPGERGE
jgi:RIO kinase 1